jgi:hypothetical protein
VKWASKQQLLESVGKPCPYCQTEMAATHRGNFPSRDHVVPRKHRRGLKSPIIICCYACNHDKGDLLLSEWVEIVRRRGTGDMKRLLGLEAFMAANPHYLMTQAILANPEPQIARPKEIMRLYPERKYNPSKQFRCRICEKQFKTIQGIEMHVETTKHAASHIYGEDIIEILESRTCDVARPLNFSRETLETNTPS